MAHERTCVIAAGRRISLAMRILPLLAMALLPLACGTNPFGINDPNNNENNVTSGGTCSGLEGHSWASTEDQPIGQRCTFDVNQNYSCVDLYGSWNITFNHGNFVWDVGDSIGEGTYTCSNGSVTGHMEGYTFDGTVAGTSLTWDGVRYRR